MAALLAGAALLGTAAVPTGAAAAGGAPAAGTVSAGGQHGGRTVDVQLLSFNDFHGNLEPPQGSSGQVTERQPDGGTRKVDAGGVEYLASALREARKGEEYSVTAAAGDLVGASPLLSGLFHDEPTVEAMNGLGLDVTSVGNHEFDEGRAELTRLQRGGCHPKDGCYDAARPFGGADYPYLAANVTDERTGEPVLAPYTVWKHKGVRIGFIGVTLEGTPDIVSADGVKGLRFHDEAETIDRYADELRRKGVRSIVALIHEGGMPSSDAYNDDCDAEGPGAGISGPVAEIAKKVSPQVDALVTGHTHQAYTCEIPDPSGAPRTVTSASSFGRLYTETTLTYDRATKDIVRTQVRSPHSANHVVRRDGPRAADMTELVRRWGERAAPVADKAVGWIAEDVPGRGAGDRPESPLGDLIADAQLAQARERDTGTDLALMNPGGVRGDLTHKASGKEGDGVVTYGEAFTVQPFSNTVNVVDLTGARLLAALREQVSGANADSPTILQVSEGLTYTLDMTASGADRVVADSVRLNGKPLDPAATYRVAMNAFLAGGGDGFPSLGKGTNEHVGPDDLTALVSYLSARSSAADPLPAPAADRITVRR